MGKVNEADVDWTELDGGERRLRRKKLATAAGGEDVGCSLYELPAGNRSWPYHYHTGNEEALFVLDGTGTLRLDGQSLPLAAGDYVALPAGEGGAHQVVNDSAGTLRYLLVSTMADPDVLVYPDSEKVGVFAGSPPGSDDERTVHGYYRGSDTVDYWTDETEGGTDDGGSEQSDVAAGGGVDSEGDAAADHGVDGETGNGTSERADGA